MEYNIYCKLKEAYETSTQSNNRFVKAIQSIKWDSEFYADGEYYFCLGRFTLTTPSLNPFKMDWTPSVITSDNSILTF